MDNYNEINQITMTLILDRLGIGYKKIWNSIHLINKDLAIADWWVVCTKWNNQYVQDFSKDRAKWPPFSFVKSYLWLSDKETFKWFDEKFWINHSYKKRDRVSKIKDISFNYIEDW